ncbi:long-chain-fatty-acid--CoA ligase [Amycolatopsis pigmentata]|uniref:Long-chain fatty acid--CoA ligase n=1 Tax=Amycolatopsis pigmentata TaxID=450801 RepID=A0ABW5FLT9_9PSEU
MTNLAELIDAAATRYPDRIAIVAGERRLPFREIRDRANSLADTLRRKGVQPGARVALSCPNVPEFTIAYWGILKAGAVVVPLNVTLRGREIAYHLEDSRSTAYIAHDAPTGRALVEAARDGFDRVESCSLFVSISDGPECGVTLVDHEPLSGDNGLPTLERGDEDTAVILYTSGTTGQPKGAELGHRNLRENALATRHVYGIDAALPDTYLCVLPLFHAFGQTCIQNGATAFGGTVVMLPRFDPSECLRLMIDERVTIFAGVPTMYWGLLGALDDATGVRQLEGSLRVAAAGGAALPAEVHRQFAQRFGVQILEGYGLSETSPTATSSVLGEPLRLGSIGRPIPGVEMKLINDDWSDVPDTPGAVGEIAIKGHNVMKGYHNRPEATAAAIRDGWFRSGDLGKKDADGFYYIVGRVKDLIIRGGFNVYPRELEEVLMTHPAVSLVAVIGTPHETLGEEIKAVAIKNDGFDDVTEADLVEWGKKQFASYKYPRVVEFVDKFPTTPTGKILKRELR